MNLQITKLSLPDVPYILSPVQVSRYAEWKFDLDDKIAGTLTEEELQTAPSLGVNKPDGVYVFSFDQGKIYIEVKNNLVQSLAGYAAAELSIFDMITEEHGQQFKQFFAGAESISNDDK